MSTTKFAWIIAFFLVNATVRCADHFGSVRDSDDSKDVDDELDRDQELDIDDGTDKEDTKHVEIEHEITLLYESDGHIFFIRGKGSLLSDINLKNIKVIVSHSRPIEVIDNPDPEPITIPKPRDNCPPGFHFLPKARTCYTVIYEEHNWTSAGQRCRDLNPKAHLAAITSRDENKALKSYLRLELRNNRHKNVCASSRNLWTSGQRMNETTCSSPFVWKISDDDHRLLQITDWLCGEPKCLYGKEHCLHMYMRSRYELGWNDLSCDSPICPLCEYDPE